MKLKEVNARLDAVGAVITEGGPKLTIVFTDPSTGSTFNFVRNVNSKGSLNSLIKALNPTGFRIEHLSKVNDLSLDELFDFESVRSTDRIFSLSLDEVQFGNGEKEMRVMFINNKHGRAFNNLAKTSDLEGFLNNLS